MDFSIKPVYDGEKKRWNVAVTGEVDIFKSSEFKDALIALTEQNAGSLALNCTELQYIDSTGLGALVAVLKRVKSAGGSISLSHLRPNLLKLFKITNLDKVFVIEGDETNE